jgi:hypothetical protein
VYTAPALPGGPLYIIGASHESQGIGEENLQELQDHQALRPLEGHLQDAEA